MNLGMAQNAFSLPRMQSLRDILEANARGNVEEKAAKALQINGFPVTFYNKRVSVAGDPDKKTRKLLKIFAQHAGAGLLPQPDDKPTIIEWGNPDSMRLPFIEIPKGQQGTFLHVKEFELPSNGEGGQSEKNRA